MILRAILWSLERTYPGWDAGWRLALWHWVDDWLPTVIGHDYRPRWATPREYVEICRERWANRRFRPSPVPPKGEKRFLHVEVDE